MPIDGYDSPRSWDILKGRVTRIAMSQFGQAAMPEASVVWHGIDTSVYKPMNKTEAKRILGYDPDRFLVLRVDKNSTRKDYPATWKALRPLLRKYPDIDVHFHCLPRASDGYDLRAVLYNDEDIRDRANFSPNLTGFIGWSDAQLAVLYAAADAFVSTSWGEGFGLGNLSAIACGTPVVATDCSAITEVVGPGGILVPPKDRITTPMGQEQCLPDIDGFTAAIERLYLSRKLRRDLASAGVAHAAQFSWDVAATKFDELIQASLMPVEVAPEPVPA
jgi:glycosyltransferase involved in cell wall biosynthesis